MQMSNIEVSKHLNIGVVEYESIGFQGYFEAIHLGMF